MQPFQWGVLTAGEAGLAWDVPESSGNSITASSTCLVVPVLHAQDIELPQSALAGEQLPQALVEVVVNVGGPPLSHVEFTARLRCESGRLAVGDAEDERTVDVPTGVLRIDVAREPAEFAERVTLRVDGG